VNLLADESVDRQIVEALRLDGHEVIYIAEIDPSISDNAVFDRANEKLALLITADKDFGEIVFRDKRLGSVGVVLIRLAGLSAETKARVVSDCIAERGKEFLHNFCVIAPGRIRISQTA
jgi:predicted nuclease of predicted toxin-antitoxin system